MADTRREAPSARHVAPGRVAYACQQMRKLLMDRDSGYGKQLLRLLVSGIRVKPGSIEIAGSSGDLEGVIEGLNSATGLQVPSPMRTWRARQESNVYRSTLMCYADVNA